jgi:RNA polymerase sigma-70 factor (ECF subfamily)
VVASRVATTNWSVVLKARSDESALASHALEVLCETYWYPVYAFVRRRGHGPADAEDLTQSYFERFLEKAWVRDVRPDKGRFRAFLLTSVRNFLLNERDRERTVKRGSGRPVASLDGMTAEERYRLEPADTVTPETLFDRAWARQVMARSLDRLREEATALAGSGERFDQLKAHITGDDSGLAYRELARCWNVSEPTVRSAVHRLRRRLGRILREEIAATVAASSDIDRELRHLLAVVG